MSVVDDFLAGVDDCVRDQARRAVEIVAARADFDVAVKWRQLTFALDVDFDHWICAVSASRKQATVKFHFGSLLDDPGVFASSDAKYVRTVGADVDAACLAGLVDQACAKLPAFKQHWGR